ncbi:MAG: hypothetical protein CMB59_05130, partial [Euryarchaeota archaeon]|nr:hypothetical protein [Euryarchaeota archaeon]
MGIEIERRFLVDGREEKPWRGGKSKTIFQCYLENVKHIDGNVYWNEHLLAEDDRELANLTTWRLRLSEGIVTLTAKGRRIGASATE